MRKSFVLLVVALFMSAFATVDAQAVVQIKLSDGSSETYQIAASGGLYFSGDSVQIVTTSRLEGMLALPLSRINSMRWGVSVDIPSVETPRFVLYPNPTHDFMSVYGLGEGLHRLSIYNIQGHLERSLLCADRQQIDVSDLPRGVYFVSVGTVTRKLIKR